ncbi:hypothetical protein SVTN_32290 [Streptomyces vietnamensis]|uniref:Uncharacterized protein n=1 Tax=Streptomyces vietnamensis TaxID=362257 RepID=A0A0B5I6W5_9ACTN|nr:hypothetical protein SVTN_32290 [Streptomyces vietnamensis]
MWRSEASGRSAMSSAARGRALAASRERIRPSRPRLAFNCGRPPLERARSAATALALRPDTQAIARSDRCGCEATILFAAIHRVEPPLSAG